MNPILMTLANDNAKTLAAMAMNSRPLSFSVPRIDFGAILISVGSFFTGFRPQAA